MKTFMDPECEVVLLRMADIITESCGIGGQGEGQTDPCGFDEETPLDPNL